MGIILFPFYLGAIAMVLKAMFMILEKYNAGTLEPSTLVYGMLCMLLIYGLIVLFYIKEKKPWGLSPFFRFPFYLIYLPFLIAYLVRIFFESNNTQLSDSLFSSTIAAGLFMIIFNSYFFQILEKLGKEKHY